MIYSRIDFIKIIASFLVVAIHTQPFKEIDGTLNFLLVNGIARVAVPFFFAAAGFMISEKSDRKKDYVKSYLSSIGKEYIKWWTIYIPIGIILIRKYPYGGTGTSFIRSVFNMLQVIFVFGTGYHLWYMAGVITAVLLVRFLIRRVGLNWTVVVGGILFLLGCTESYLGIIKNVTGFDLAINMLDWYYEIFITSRNGIFFGVIFVAMGMKIQKSKKEMSEKSIIAGSFLSIIMLLVEGMFLREYGGALDFNFLLSTVPAVWFILNWAKMYKRKSNDKDRRVQYETKMIYFIHLAVMIINEQILSNMGLGYLWGNGIIRFASTIVVTVASIKLLSLIRKWREMNNRNRLRSFEGVVWCKRAY